MQLQSPHMKVFAKRYSSYHMCDQVCPPSHEGRLTCTNKQLVSAPSIENSPVYWLQGISNALHSKQQTDMERAEGNKKKSRVVLKNGLRHPIRKKNPEQEVKHKNTTIVHTEISQNIIEHNAHYLPGK